MKIHFQIFVLPFRGSRSRVQSTVNQIGTDQIVPRGEQEPRSTCRCFLKEKYLVIVALKTSFIGFGILHVFGCRLSTD